MKFLKKKRYIMIFIVLVVTIVFAIFINSAPKETYAEVSDFYKVGKMELVDNVNIKGVVVSSNSQSVYSSLGYKILKVNYEVGDRVSAGDQLMVLDTDELTGSINERRAQLDKQSESNLTQLETAKRQYNEAVANLNSEQDSNLVSAKSRITSALNTLENAQKNYDDKVKEINERDNSQVVNAESTLRNAEIELEKKQSDYDKNKTLYDSGVISQNEVTLSEQALTSAKNSLEDAKKSIELIENSLETELDTYKQNLDSAQIAYDEALQTLESTKLSLEQSVEKYNDTVKSSEVAINSDSDLIALKNLEDKLNKAYVTAPISGTVTAVYAKEGNNASGLMFVIEDTENLKIETKVKEIDANSVKVGMEVIIKSDATGDAEYSGQISKIAPTSTKNAQGETTLGSDVEFETEITVTSENTDLKIGMNTKLTVVLNRKEDVLAVPFDVLGEDEDGNDIIFILEKADEEGIATVKAIKVDIVSETDFYAEIESQNIYDGLEIISDTTNITDGVKVKIVSEDLNE